MKIHTKFVNILCLIAILAMTGCSTTTKKDHAISLDQLEPNAGFNSDTCNKLKILKDHVIATDERGAYIPITFKLDSDNSTKKCPTESQLDEMHQHIKSLINTIKQSGKKPLIFIHGGLNSYQQSLERAVRDAGYINKEGIYYPVFIIWPSGIDTYGDSLVNYFQGEWNTSYDRYSWPLRFGSDLIEMPARLIGNYFTHARLRTGSSCYLNRFRNILEPFSTLFTWGCEGDYKQDSHDFFVTSDPCEKTSDRPQGTYCIDEDKNDANAFLIRNIEKTPLSSLKLLTIPAMDPLAKRAWRSMLARIHFAFRTPCPVNTHAMGTCAPAAVYEFFKALNEPSINDITLIGHSMGTIVAGEIIREFPDLPYANVVFAGAAISIREFENTVEAVLKSKLKNASKLFKFYNLSLHPYAEATEENAYGAMPSGSLLEWIDQTIENPSDSLDRTLGKWTNIAPLLGRPENEKDQVLDKDLIKQNLMYFSRFGLKPNQPLEHTHFGNAGGVFKYWVDECWLPSEVCSYVETCRLKNY